MEKTIEDFYSKGKVTTNVTFSQIENNGSFSGTLFADQKNRLGRQLFIISRRKVWRNSGLSK